VRNCLFGAAHMGKRGAEMGFSNQVRVCRDCAVPELVFALGPQREGFRMMVTSCNKVSAIVFYAAKPHERSDRYASVTAFCGEGLQFYSNCLCRSQIGARFGRYRQRT